MLLKYHQLGVTDASTYRFTRYNRLKVKFTKFFTWSLYIPGDGEKISAGVTMADYRKVADVKTCHSLTTVGCYGTTFYFIGRLIYEFINFRTDYFIAIDKTRSSPQSWSGHSSTAHNAFDLRSLIVRFFKNINSEPEIVVSNVLYWHFRKSSTVWLQFEMDTFRPPVAGLGRRGSGCGPFHSLPIGS